MLKRKRILLATCICSILFTITAFAATWDSKGWNVYNSSGTVYANVGVTFVSGSFASKADLSYSARVLGEDAEYVTNEKKLELQLLEIQVAVLINTFTMITLQVVQKRFQVIIHMLLSK